jgi:hypothetical protein
MITDAVALAPLHAGLGGTLPALVPPPVNDHVHRRPPLGSEWLVHIPVIPLYEDEAGWRGHVVCRCYSMRAAGSRREELGAWANTAKGSPG